MYVYIYTIYANILIKLSPCLAWLYSKKKSYKMILTFDVTFLYSYALLHKSRERYNCTPRLNTTL